MKISCKWKNIWPFSDNLAAVENEKWKWGYIDKKGRCVIPCKWLRAFPFSDGIAEVENDSGDGFLIDKTGCIV